MLSCQAVVVMPNHFRQILIFKYIDKGTVALDFLPLLGKKNSIIKKYRKKFEELKISKIRNSLEYKKSKNE